MGARIEAVEARGFVLRVAGAMIRVEDAPGARFWRGRASAERGDFARGEEVIVRLDPRGRVAKLREMTDRAGADWLAARRGGVTRGRVLAISATLLRLKLETGPFEFALTRGTVLPLGEPLKPGDEVWVRGRGSESLDSGAAEVSRSPLEVRPVTVRGEERIAEGIIRLVSPQGDEIVLIVGDKSLALPMTATTPVWDEGRRVPRGALVPGVRVRAVWTLAASGGARIRRIEVLEFPR